ncbi:MAG: GAF domain-containing protein [Firmicutes bacterium]|nr:GAF domain-containing protein [Bacillota bacterium]
MRKVDQQIIAKLTGVQSTRQSHYAELKRTIEEMSKQNKRLEIINQIARSINVDMTYDEIIERVAEPLRQVMAYDLLSFCLLDRGELVIKSGIPKDQKILGVGTVLTRENSAPWKAIEDNQCFLRLDIWNDKNKYQEDSSLKLIGIQSAIMAPLLVRGEVIGTLNFGSKNPYAYSKSDFVFVQHLADQLAVCLSNSNLYNEVLKSKKVWESTFQAVPDLLFVINKKFEVISINRDTINSRPAYEVIGQKCYEKLNSVIKCDLCPAVKAFETGQPASAEMKGPAGKIMDIAAFPVLSSKGEVLEVVCHVKDVTEKLRMESQLFQSAKLAAIGEMAAGVAHELNSPLTAILGNAQLVLRKKPNNQPEYRLLEDIKKCGTRCKRIIENLLTFSRQDKQQANQMVDINCVVENALSLIRYQIEQNGTELVVKQADDLPMIHGNSQQLEQVVLNLLLNAKDALGEKESKYIKITTGLKNNENNATEIFLKVGDNGCGIPKENMEQIFNPFFTTKEVQKGTGLGLSVSIGIAESHGGRIEVESKINQGSIFTMVLPLQDNDVEV